jgi:tetraacyldisaccharide 4'-kinase
MDDRLSQLLNAVWYRNHPLRWLLWPLGRLFEAAARLRRTLYLRGLKRVVTADVPVIVVGNVTVGGTGKTPCVIWLADELMRRGFRVGIVSRGYGGRAEHWPQRVGADSDPALCGDEPVLLAQRTGCPVVAGPDRPAAVGLLLAEKQVDVVLSDDGLQHYRMGRALEIAVVDGIRGLGNGLCLPAGPLREPAERLREVDAVVVNGGRWGSRTAFRAALEVTGATRLTDGQRRTLGAFAAAPVHAVAAIGHPARFFEMLSAAGLDVRPVALRDHARIDAARLDFGDGLPVLITEKDAVKCRRAAPDNVWCVTVEMRFANEDGERLMRLVVRDLAQGV